MNELSVKKLSKSFKDNKVLNSIDFTVSENEIVCLMGPSGIGKSTFLNCITNLIKPDEGSITINNIPNTAKEYQKQIGLVFQNYNLLPLMNVYENIVLPIKLDGIKPDNDYIEEILKLLKLEDKKYFMPNQLSGGQQQRVALARALAIKPAIILADEPTGNLDSRTSQDVLGLIKISSQNLAQTIVMITHNEEIAQMADRIIRIEDGKIVKGGE